MYSIIFVKIPTYHFILFPIFYWCTQQTLYVPTQIFCIVILLNKQKNTVTILKAAFQVAEVKKLQSWALGLHLPSKSSQVINEFAHKQQAGKLLQLGQHSALFPGLSSMSHAPTEGDELIWGVKGQNKQITPPFQTPGEKRPQLCSDCPGNNVALAEKYIWSDLQWCVALNELGMC